MQAVIVDTERGVEEVRSKVDRLLVEDADWRGLVSVTFRRGIRVTWVAAAGHQSAGRKVAMDTR